MLTDDNAARFLAKDGRIARGIKQVVNVPNPGAGNQWSARVPGGEQWFIRAGLFQFATSAVVANRQVKLSLTVDGVIVYQMADSTLVTASQTVIYNTYMSDSPVPVASGLTIGQLQMPELALPPGSTIGTVTLAMDVGDAFTNINLYVARHYMTDGQAESYAAEELDEVVQALQKEMMAT